MLSKYMYYVHFVMMCHGDLIFQLLCCSAIFFNFAIKKYINIELNQDTYIFGFKLLALNSLNKENIQTILVSELIVLRNF